MRRAGWSDASATVVLASVFCAAHFLFRVGLNVVPLSYTLCVSQLAFLAVVFVFPKRADALMRRLAVPHVSALVYVAGTVVAYVVPLRAVTLVATALVALALQSLMLYTGLLLVGRNKKSCHDVAFLGMLASLLVALTTFSLPFWTALVIHAALILMSARLIDRDFVREPAPSWPSQCGGTAAWARLPWKYVTLIFFFSLGFHLIGPGTGVGLGGWQGTFALASVIGTIVIALDMLVFRSRLTPFVEVSVGIMVAVPVLFHGGGFGESGMLLPVASAGYFLLTPCYYQYILMYAQDEEVSPCRLFAVMAAMNSFGQLTGGLASSLPVLSAGTRAGFAFSVVVALAVLFCAFIPMADAARDLFLRTLDRGDATVGVGASEVEGVVVWPVAGSLDERVEGGLLSQIEASCKMASQRYGLTRREGEVLVYLTRMCTLRSIGEELGLSLNTVKTHALHIYQKLDAHSREELFEAVERAAREDVASARA